MEIVYVEEGQHLAHHGILGQKWGVRRFQNKDGSLTIAGKQRYGVSKSKPQKTELEDPYDHSSGKSNLLLKSIAATSGLALLGARIGGRIAGPNGLLTGAAIGASAGLIVTGKNIVQNRLAKKNEQSIFDANKESGEIDSKTGFYKKAKREYTEEEDIRAVNPGFKKFTDDTHNNCVLCALTYNLRQMGYAVSANYASYGYKTEDLKRWFKNPKIVSHDIGDSFRPNFPNDKNFKTNQKDMIRKVHAELQSEGPGSRGYLSVAYYIPNEYGPTEYGGHAMAYKVNSDRTVDIIDAQTGKTYKNAFNETNLNAIQSPKDVFNKNNCGILRYSLTADHVRLDNLKINTDTIQEVAHS